jgi:diketogulonate reductase-like aldo/keto reductase
MERDPAESIAALRVGLDLGMTHVDTAEMYGSGRVEEVVGRAIAGRRDEVFLASKVLPQNASRAGTVEACERSLRRLRTDHLDLYLLHSPSTHQFDETLAAFEQLEAEGKIVLFGVSNFDARLLDHAAPLAGPGRIACNQVLYNLEDRAIEHEVLPACERHGAALVGYSPFGQGDFPADHSVLVGIAQAHSVTAYNIALAFLTRRPSLFTLAKSSSRRHVEENAAAGDLELSAEEVALIDEAFPL